MKRCAAFEESFKMVQNATRAHALLEKHISNEVEELWVIALRANLTRIHQAMLFRGGVDRCYIHLREIFRYLIKCNASRFIIAHSHPSGDLEASPEDIEVTRRINQAANLFEIPLDDHLIIYRNRFLSMAEQGLIPRTRLKRIENKELLLKTSRL